MNVVRQQGFPEQTRWWLPHSSAINDNGANFAITTDTAVWFNMVASQSPPAINDSWHHVIYMKKGTYAMRLLHFKTAGSGILSLSIFGNNLEGTFFADTLDLYNVATLKNQIYGNTAVNIARDAFCTLQGTLGTKNAASGGYNCTITVIELWRTGN